MIINILGIIAIVTSFYFTNRYFQEQEQTMAMEESSYESTEGSVIEELKRQAEEKLNKKQVVQVQVDCRILQNNVLVFSSYSVY